MIAKWYILHSISGSEKKVKKLIEEQIAKKHMSEYFEEILIPVILVPEIKRGRKVVTEKKFMPGYILIKMKMTDESWHLVKSVPKITGFLGTRTKPKAMNDQEIKRILKQIEFESKNLSVASLYHVGDKIQVIDGPFDSFSGFVEEVNSDSQKLKISVFIFGKATPIELNFNQVKKSTQVLT